jgi:hypothetical protein
VAMSCRSPSSASGSDAISSITALARLVDRPGAVLAWG